MAQPKLKLLRLSLKLGETLTCWNVQMPPACMCLCLHSAKTCCFRPKPLNADIQILLNVFLGLFHRAEAYRCTKTHDFSVKKQMFAHGAPCKHHTYGSSLTTKRVLLESLRHHWACVTYLQAVVNLNNKTAHQIGKKKRGRAVFTVTTNDTQQRSQRTARWGSLGQSNSWKCH